MKPVLVLALLFYAVPARADETVYRISEAVAVIGHGADLGSTQRCLGSGRCKELNPWLVRFNEPLTFAVAKMSVASIGIWAASKIPNKTLGAIVNFGVGSAFLAIAVRNTQVGK